MPSGTSRIAFTAFLPDISLECLREVFFEDWMGCRPFITANASTLTNIQIYTGPRRAAEHARIDFPKLTAYQDNHLAHIESAPNLVSFKCRSFTVCPRDDSKGTARLFLDIARLSLSTLTVLDLTLMLYALEEKEDDAHLLSSIIKACPSLVKLSLDSCGRVPWPRINGWTQPGDEEGDMRVVCSLMKGLQNIAVFGFHYTHWDCTEGWVLSQQQIEKEQVWVSMLATSCPALTTCKFGTSQIAWTHLEHSPHG